VVASQEVVQKVVAKQVVVHLVVVQQVVAHQILPNQASLVSYGMLWFILRLLLSRASTSHSSVKRPKS
jgi:hypothetical protein